MPSAPVLLPAVAAGAAGELDDARAACALALADLDDPNSASVVLVAAGPRTAVLRAPVAGSLAGLGLDVGAGLGGAGIPPPSRAELSAASTVGAWLIAEYLGSAQCRLAVEVGPGVEDVRAAADHLIAIAADGAVWLVVAGDGSARRTIAAPGHFDERSEPYDEAVAAALATADAGMLAGLDLELGAQLLCAGAPAWAAVGGAVLASAATGRYQAAVHYSQIPYGVAYFVASWAVAGD